MTEQRIKVETEWVVKYRPEDDCMLFWVPDSPTMFAAFGGNWPPDAKRPEYDSPRRAAEELRERESLAGDQVWGKDGFAGVRLTVTGARVLGHLLRLDTNRGPIDVDDPRRLAIFRRLYALKPDECWDVDRVVKMAENEVRDDQGRVWKVGLKERWRLLGTHWGDGLSPVLDQDILDVELSWLWGLNGSTITPRTTINDPDQRARVRRYIESRKKREPVVFETRTRHNIGHAAGHSWIMNERIETIPPGTRVRVTVEPLGDG